MLSNLATYTQRQAELHAALVAKLTAVNGRVLPLSQSSTIRYNSEHQANARAVITVSTVELFAHVTAANTVTMPAHGYAVGNFVSVLPDSGNRVISTVTAVTANTFTVSGTLELGHAWVARLPRLLFDQASAITSGYLETVPRVDWLGGDIQFDANTRAGLTFDLTFPKPSIWSAPVVAARQNIDAQTAFGVVYSRDYPTGTTARLRFSNLNNVGQTTSLQVRF